MIEDIIWLLDSIPKPIMKYISIASLVVYMCFAIWARNRSEKEL